jgi:ComF family protein
VVAGFSYGGVARDLVLGLKFRGRLEAVRPLAQRLADAVRARRIPGDLLVPVPLGARRRRERGYDQAALLAEHLGRRLDVALEPAGLVRRRHTPPQALLGRRRRLRSPKGAFAAHRPRVADRAVLLVDDVLTTGGTARACAVALRRAGARAVVAAVACRAEVAAAPDGRRRAGAKVSGGGGPSP